MTEEERARLADKLDLRQKIRLLTGATTWRTHAEPVIGLAPMTTSDGPAGIRGEAWDERDTSLLLPSASALAATWDEPLVERLGALLAAEAGRKGVDMVLAPTLNLHRTPLGGRHFECFSEDPQLTARTGAALIRGIQKHGVAATAKHYVANDSETDRLTVDVRIGERALREVYLAPFEAAVQAGVWAVMAGYNGVNGATMTESPLLAEPLKGEWGFDGVVVSDWGAVRTTAPSARAALDLAMPGPDGPWAEALFDAVQEGSVPVEAVDDKVRRLLRLAARVGALGEPATRRRAEPSAHRALLRQAARRRAEPSARRALLRRAVAAGSVLLHNRGVLPFDRTESGTVAVIGTHAAQPRTQGGGSAGVFPERLVTVVDGIRDALPAGPRVIHVPGPALDAPPQPLEEADCRNPRTGAPGVLLRVLAADGRELHAEHRLSARQLEPPLPPGAHTVEISAVLPTGTGGAWCFGVGGFGRMTLTVDDEVVVDGEFPPLTGDPAVLHVNPPRQYGRTTLPAGQEALVVARRELAPGTGRATLLTAAPPTPDPDAAIAAAAEAARRADAAVVVVGTTETSESEGLDRTTLALPARQDDLVRAVCAANPRTAVVLNTGSPVELPWREEAGAILLTWFPGQEGGAGIADVLFGDVEPGGRLPTTWAATTDDLPVSRTRPENGTLDYTEGLHIGYRAWLRTGRRPAYWFGHGVGYTTWTYEDLTVRGDGQVTVRVRNTGHRRGREVVQVYLSRPVSEVERPIRWLAGYMSVEADPGEATTAEVRLPVRAFQHWCDTTGGWRIEPGEWQVLVGRSAGELPLSATVDAHLLGPAGS